MIGRGWLIAAASLATGACGAPASLYRPEAATVSRGGELEVEFTGTDVDSRRARIAVRHKSADRKLKVESIEICGDDGEALREIGPRGAGDDGEFELPSLDSISDGDTIHLRVDVRFADESKQPLERSLALRVRSAELGSAPREVGHPVTWLALTYPVWGLPRDLLDLPLTAINRGGMTVEDCSNQRISSAKLVIVGVAATGAVIGIIQGWEHANPHLYEQLFYGGLGGDLGSVLGLAAGYASVVAWQLAVVPAQTALLRTGVDRDFIKEDLRDSPIAADTEAVRSHREAWLRSAGFFPNWKWIVRGTTVEAGPEAMRLPVLESIEISEPPAE